MVLCDFFPLYDFGTNKCLSGTEDNTYADLIDEPIDERPRSHIPRLTVNKTINETFEYGLQRYNRPAATEILLTIWVFTLLCEEIRQVNILIFDLNI